MDSGCEVVLLGLPIGLQIAAALLAMFLGALFGAVLLAVGPSPVLSVALMLLAAIAVVRWRLSAPGAGWATAS
ncbi:hypothetical protein [Streptomyces melanogenes]|uniref:hypothetical protein n=1 Tax=Streptomyces melanogenes TaxID=67326 RepID=UPI0037B80B52